MPPLLKIIQRYKFSFKQANVRLFIIDHGVDGFLHLRHH